MVLLEEGEAAFIVKPRQRVKCQKERWHESSAGGKCMATYQICFCICIRICICTSVSILKSVFAKRSSSKRSIGMKAVTAKSAARQHHTFVSIFVSVLLSVFVSILI